MHNKSARWRASDRSRTVVKAFPPAAAITFQGPDPRHHLRVGAQGRRQGQQRKSCEGWFRLDNLMGLPLLCEDLAFVSFWLCGEASKGAQHLSVDPPPAPDRRQELVPNPTHPRRV